MAKKRYITPSTDIVTLPSPHILLPGSPGCGNNPASSYTTGSLIMGDEPTDHDGDGVFDD